MQKEAQTPYLGQKLWCCFYSGMLIEVKIRKIRLTIYPPLELAEALGLDIEEHPAFGRHAGSIWLIQEESGSQVLAFRPGDNGVYESYPIELSQEQLQSCRRSYAIFWTDEPLGCCSLHDYDLWTTQREALRSIAPAPRRSRNRAHKKLSTWRERCIKRMNKKSADLSLVTSEAKRVYIKR